MHSTIQCFCNVHAVGSIYIYIASLLHINIFTLTDIDECFTGTYTCNGDGEECENLPGSYRCACSKKLNLIKVNGTCVCKYTRHGKARVSVINIFRGCGNMQTAE